MINGKCYIILRKGFEAYNGDVKYAEIPCYPDEFQESTSANWSQQEILGRGAPIYSYSSTNSRNVNFNFTMHREMESTDKIERILSMIRASVYAYETNSGLYPVLTTFIFGRAGVRGIVRNVGFNWKTPIIDDEYQVCDVSVSIDEVPTVYKDANNLATISNNKEFKLGHDVSDPFIVGRRFK